MDKLNGCPFCGSKPELRYCETVEIGEAHYVKCTHCGVEQHGFYSEKEAVQRWNTRFMPDLM